MKHIKNVLSLVLAVAMIFTCGLSVAFAKPVDASDSTTGIVLNDGSSTYQDGDSYNTSWSINYSQYIRRVIDPQVVSNEKVKSITISDDTHFTAPITTIVKNAITGKWETSIGLRWGKDMPASAQVGDQVTADMTVTLENGDSATFHLITTITNNPVYRHQAHTDTGAEVSIHEVEVGKNYIVSVLVIDKDNVLQGKTPTYLHEIISGNEFAKLETLADGTVKLTALAVGKFNISTDIYVDNLSAGGIGSYCNVSGPLGDLTTSDIDNAVNNAVNGTTSLNVPVNSGLSADLVKDLAKKATGNGLTEVKLTHNGNQDLTMSFDPAKVPANWSGSSFTPAFNMAKPDDAQHVSYRHGQWVDFVYSGSLPAPMTITMKVDPVLFPANTTKYSVWYFHPATGEMTEQALEVIYNVTTSTITFTLPHFSAYLIMPAGEKPMVSPLPSAGSGYTTDTSSSSSVAYTSASTSGIAEGGSMNINLIDGEFVHYTTVDELAGRDITVIATYKGKTYKVNARALAKSAPGRIAYTPEEFIAHLQGKAVSKPADSSNPDTGANDFVGLAMALSVLSLSGVLASKKLFR